MINKQKEKTYFSKRSKSKDIKTEIQELLIKILNRWVYIHTHQKMKPHTEKQGM